MVGARLLRFLTFVALLDVIALALLARFAPPDPYTQLFVGGPMLLTAPVLAYWFVFVRGRTRKGRADAER